MSSQYLIAAPLVRIFTDPKQFNSIFFGSIYIGNANEDPLNPSQQQPIYVVNEDGSRTQVEQPIKIGSGGYAEYNGTPSKFVCDDKYSLVVLDKNGAEKWREDDISTIDPFQFMHGDLLGRNAADSHPASAISTSKGGNVQEFIDNIPTEYDLFVIYGQSNAVGFASNSSGRGLIPDHSFFWYNRGNLKEWREIEYDMPYIDGSLTTTSTGNAWVEFAREHRKRTGKGCLFIPAAYGGLSITQLSPPSVHWDALSIALGEVKADTTYNIVSTNMLWCQGESDMTDGTSQSEYLSLFVSLWNGFKGIAGASKCYISRVGNPRTRPETSRAQIQTAQDYLCRNISDVFMAYSGAGSFTVTGETLLPDETHYAQKGYNLMGRAMAETVANVQQATQAITDHDSEYPAFLRTPDDQIHHAVVANLKHNGTNFELQTINDGGRWRSYCIESFSELGTAIVLTLGISTQDILTMGVEVNRTGEQYGIKATARDGSTNGAIVIELYADTQAIVDTANGNISYPPGGSGADTGLLSDLSATIDSGITKLTYSPHQYTPLVRPFTINDLNNFIPIAQNATASNSTWFKYQSTPTETKAIVDFKSKPLDPSALKINGLELRFFAIIGDRLN